MSTSYDQLFEPFRLRRGRSMPNRFMLAPLTNLQNHPDGVLSDEEFNWLTMRARGGFGAVMTCAAHVQARGQGFPGQLGIFSDRHLPGLTRLAAEIRRHGSVALTQLHHAGIRSPQELIGEQPIGPSDDDKTGARAMSTGEVEQLADDFVAAAVRAEQAGFDGIELHGAHSYVICAFLSPGYNRRDDRYGGSTEGRSQLLDEIIAGIRAACRPDFIVGVRLSPERFGLDTVEMVDLAGRLLIDDRVDFIDMSLWDCAKEASDERFAGRRLIDLFTTLPRNGVRLGVAGQLYSSTSVADVLAHGADFALLGRAGILHHDVPRRMRDPAFVQASLPVSREYLRSEGLSPAFVEYMNGWEGFVAD